MILANTYHLMLRPGAERVARLGGLHSFMRWEKPILTDSGGFQVMSLAKLRKITDHGVTFQSHIDGSTHALTPERAIEIQCLLGADIQMQLDECVALPATPAEMRTAVDAVARLGQALPDGIRATPRRRSRTARARPCSASCKVEQMRDCGSARPKVWWPWTFQATPSAVSRSVSRRT